jgi:hypothetical protein
MLGSVAGISESRTWFKTPQSSEKYRNLSDFLNNLIQAWLDRLRQSLSPFAPF